MKRMLVISLICMLTLLSFGSVVLASDNGNKVTEKITVNEYEMLQSLSKNTDQQLAELGYDSGEIKKVKNYHQEYVKH